MQLNNNSKLLSSYLLVSKKKLVGALLRKVVFGSRYGRKINKKMMTLHQRRQ